MPSDPITIVKSALMLVEGSDEQQYWRGIFERYWHRTDIQVEQFHGKSGLRTNIRVFANAPGFDQVRWLGVSRDADNDAFGVAASIRDALRAVGLPVPAGAWEPSEGLPVTVAFVWPGERETGELEDALMKCYHNDPVADCVDHYLSCLASISGPALKAGKAWVRAFLASRPRPTWRLGEVAGAGELPEPQGDFFERVRGLLPSI